MADLCATCASSYDDSNAALSEKPLTLGRRLPCCDRSICSRCLLQNRRYNNYCPYCQISTEPTSLPQNLRDPPSYSSIHDSSLALTDRGQSDDEHPPAYFESSVTTSLDEKRSDGDISFDVLHFVQPGESMLSIALAYNVPVQALRRTNNIFSDHLVQARRTILIPSEYYKGGVSLSPRPIEGEEEEARKGKLRKWMVTCKVAEYDVAELYLRQAEWDLQAAIEAYREDEQWERDHPLTKKEAKSKGISARHAGMRRFVGSASATNGVTAGGNRPG